MLFSYEFKKILRRISPLLVLIVLLLTSIFTMTLTYFGFNHTDDIDPNITSKYTALETKINNWDEINREDFDSAFLEFNEDYKSLNASTFDGKDLIDNYEKASESFATFYNDYYQNITSTNKDISTYLLIQKKHLSNLNQIMESLDSYLSINLEDYDTDKLKKNAIINGLKNTNPSWNNQTLQTILKDLFYVQKISDADKTELKKFFEQNPSGENRDYTDAYDYALNRYWAAVASVSEFAGNLSQYDGFDGYNDIMTSQKAYKLANYRLSNAERDFANPFQFGNIFNKNSNQVSLFDFVFNNLEIAMFAIMALVIIWAGSAFFTDQQEKTLIAPIAAGKKRWHIILSKMMVVLILAIVSLLILTGIYVASGLVFFNAYISPDILFLFNGSTPLVMAPANYFAVYFLGLIYKLLPFIAICGLFAFSKAKPFVLVGVTLIIYLVIVILNGCLGSFWFYQFMPWLGLDPIRYFDAKLLFAPMPSSYNIWYTLPTMTTIIVILYWALINKFNKHDFY